MKSRYVTLITVVCLTSTGCSTTSPVTSISLDFPTGELRLHVQRDGDVRLSYGALPTYRVVESGAFDIDELFQQLETRLHDVVPGEDRPLGQPHGMVALRFSDGTKREHLIYDQAFAEEQLKLACANSVRAEETVERIFTAECAKLGGTTP